jgi:hypothetical protein
MEFGDCYLTKSIQKHAREGRNNSKMPGNGIIVAYMVYVDHV